MGADRDPARDHELPQAQVLQAQRVDAAVLQEAGADVHLVVDAVRLLLLEVVREHALRRLLLEVEVRRDASAMPVTLSSNSRRRWYTVPSRASRPPGTRRSARGRRRPNVAEMIQQALDLGPQERDDPDLVARVERALDLGGAVVDPVGELVQRRQGPRLARGLDHRLREAELGEQIGLDGRAPLRRRPADVGEPVERVHALEDDRLQLGHRARGAPRAARRR